MLGSSNSCQADAIKMMLNKDDISTLRNKLDPKFPRHIMKQACDSPEGKHAQAIHVKTNGDLMTYPLLNNANHKNRVDRQVDNRRVSYKPAAIKDSYWPQE